MHAVDTGPCTHDYPIRAAAVGPVLIMFLFFTSFLSSYPSFHAFLVFCFRLCVLARLFKQQGKRGKETRSSPARIGGEPNVLYQAAFSEGTGRSGVSFQTTKARFWVTELNRLLCEVYERCITPLLFQCPNMVGVFGVFPILCILPPYGQLSSV